MAKRKKPKVTAQNKLGENSRLWENMNPVEASRIIEDLIMNPEKTLVDIGRSEGVPAHIVEKINARLKTRFYNWKNAAQAVNGAQLRPAIEHRMFQLLDSIDESAIQEASPYQRTLMFGILFDKKQLMDGKPTHITETHQGDKAVGALQAVAEELARRGMRIPAPAETTDLEEQPDGTFS